MKSIKLTQKELEELCGKFFDRGYYGGLYQDNTNDNSVRIFMEIKKQEIDKIFNNI